MSGAPGGQVADFVSGEQLLAALRQLRELGIDNIEACSPQPLAGLADALGLRRSRLPLISLLGGVFGGAGMLALQWYSAVIAYPLDIGGRPPASWPAFGPAALEMSLLFAALFGFAAFLRGSSLPRLHHPAFDAAAFARASSDRYCLVLPAVEAGQLPQVQQVLLAAGALSITRIDP